MVAVWFSFFMAFGESLDEYMEDDCALMRLKQLTEAGTVLFYELVHFNYSRRTAKPAKRLEIRGSWEADNAVLTLPGLGACRWNARKKPLFGNGGRIAITRDLRQGQIAGTTAGGQSTLWLVPCSQNHQEVRLNHTTSVHSGNRHSEKSGHFLHRMTCSDNSLQQVFRFIIITSHRFRQDLQLLNHINPRFVSYLKAQSHIIRRLAVYAQFPNGNVAENRPESATACLKSVCVIQTHSNMSHRLKLNGKRYDEWLDMYTSIREPHGNPPEPDVENLPKVIEKIAQRSRGFLRELFLKGCQNVTDDAIKRFTQLCRLIEYLNLSGCKNLTNDTCEHLGQNCPQLMTLLLESCSKIDDTGMELLSWCSNLTVLDVSWCTVGDRGLTAIARGCKGLQRFRAVGCREITSRGVQQLAERCHGLILLNLNYCGQSITDEAMVHLATGCTELRVLAVSHCSITDLGLRALAGTLSPTASASILGQNGAGAHQNGSALVLRVPAPPTANGSAHRSSVGENNGADGDAGSGETVSPRNRRRSPPLPLVGCVHLTTLEIARCTAITDIGLTAVARVCNKLEKLDLEDCALVTDASLAQLAVHCPHLNNLILSHCDQITDEGIARLAEGLCGPDQLQELAMDNCPLLTDTALEHLGSNCRRLQRLDLYDCQQITKQGIFNLEVGGPFDLFSLPTWFNMFPLLLRFILLLD
ncbi:F-box and leucine-rich repeat protein 2/20 [Clonorchis sinensis]|uniref:F-box and leucine-rich repeat protein 2/20 n=1 Tax=Clonorchis sinensis TaxID=79923 RepID=G7YN02_CLOSI|nr:F-box and leucine-rich repeat protein 2/20 [Clonorchis sinensis]